MEQTLRITNVLADPTRYYIYQYIVNNHQDVSVQQIADSFKIHPNVARLHLSKLEDVDMLTSDARKTGKGVALAGFIDYPIKSFNFIFHTGTISFFQELPLRR